MELKQDVYWRDVLRTTPQGRMRVLLRDGSQLSLGANSTLLIVQHDSRAQQTVLGLVSGTLRGRIAPQVMPKAQFRIHTRTAVIGVIGTDFYVESEPDRTMITCYSGMVGVRDLTGERKALVRAGEQLEFDRTSRPHVRSLPKEHRRHGQEDTHIDGLDDADLHVEAKLERSLDSKKDKPGDKVSAKTTRDIRLSDGTILPKGSQLTGRVAEVRKRDKTDSARLGVVFDEATTRDGRTVPLRATVQAVRVPFSEQRVTMAEAMAERSATMQKDRIKAERLRTMARGESDGVPGPAASPASGGGSGGGGGGADSGGGGGGGDDHGGGDLGGGGGADVGGGTGGGTIDDHGGSTGLDDNLRSDDRLTGGTENEIETERSSGGSDDRLGGDDRLGSDDNGAEVATNFRVGSDDELGESSHGVGGVAGTRLMFRPLTEGYDTVLVSARDDIYIAKGSDLVLRIDLLSAPQQR